MRSSSVWSLLSNDVVATADDTDPAAGTADDVASLELMVDDTMIPYIQVSRGAFDYCIRTPSRDATCHWASIVPWNVDVATFRMPSTFSTNNEYRIRTIITSLLGARSTSHTVSSLEL